MLRLSTTEKQCDQSVSFSTYSTHYKQRKVQEVTQSVTTDIASKCEPQPSITESGHHSASFSAIFNLLYGTNEEQYEMPRAINPLTMKIQTILIIASNEVITHYLLYKSMGYKGKDSP